MRVSEILAVGAQYAWEDSAEEIARMMESLDKQDVEFVLSQVRAIVTYIRSKSPQE